MDSPYKRNAELTQVSTVYISIISLKQLLLLLTSQMLLVSLSLQVFLMLLASLLSCLGLGISDKKIIPRRRNRRNKWLFPTEFGCSAEANSQNSVLNPSAEENTTRNSVPWNQNRCKFSEFRSEPFRGRELNSEFLSVQQKI
jgi:hypothetical protein